MLNRRKLLQMIGLSFVAGATVKLATKKKDKVLVGKIGINNHPVESLVDADFDVRIVNGQLQSVSVRQDSEFIKQRNYSVEEIKGSFDIPTFKVIKS